jgi:hypothetical protein
VVVSLLILLIWLTVEKFDCAMEAFHNG